MGVKLGSDDVSFRLGATTPAKVYLGSQEVWSAVSVPSAPQNVIASGDSVYFDAPASDGGSAITGYKIRDANTDDDFTSIFSRQSGGPFTVGEAQYDEKWSLDIAETLFVAVAAVNAIGEGPKSSPGVLVEKT
jgi:hypothetical protein